MGQISTECCPNQEDGGVQNRHSKNPFNTNYAADCEKNIFLAKLNKFVFGPTPLKDLTPSPAVVEKLRFLQSVW